MRMLDFSPTVDLGQFDSGQLAEIVDFVCVCCVCLLCVCLLCVCLLCVCVSAVCGCCVCLLCVPAVWVLRN